MGNIQSNIEHVVFEWAEIGLLVDEVSPAIQHVLFQNNDIGLRVAGRDRPRLLHVRDSVFTKNDEGVSFYFSGNYYPSSADPNDVLIEGSVFTDNNDAVDFYYGGSARFKNNTFDGNEIAIDTSQVYELEFEGDLFANNDIALDVGYSNEGKFILSRDANNPTTFRDNLEWNVRSGPDELPVSTNPVAKDNIDGRNVNWGTTDPNEINARIYDFFDDVFHGLVVHDFSPYLGDTNDNFIVDITDFNTLSANFDPDGVNPQNNTYIHGDFDADLDIDITDFNILSGNFGNGDFLATGTAVASRLLAIPEPSTGVLVLLGGLLFALFKCSAGEMICRVESGKPTKRK